MSGISLKDVLGEIKEEGTKERRSIEAAEKAAEILFELSEARIRRGMTQRQLAEKTGIPQPNINKIEAAKVMPRLDTLLKIAECVGVEIRAEEQKSYEAATVTKPTVYMLFDPERYFNIPAAAMGV